METFRRHPVYASLVVGLIAFVAGLFLSTTGDLLSAFMFDVLAVALAIAVYVVLRRKGPRAT